MLFEAQIHDFKMWFPWFRIRREQGALRAVVEQQRRMMTPEEVAEQSAMIIAQLAMSGILFHRADGIRLR